MKRKTTKAKYMRGLVLGISTGVGLGLAANPLTLFTPVAYGVAGGLIAHRKITGGFKTHPSKKYNQALKSLNKSLTKRINRKRK